MASITLNGNDTVPGGTDLSGLSQMYSSGTLYVYTDTYPYRPGSYVLSNGLLGSSSRHVDLKIVSSSSQTYVTECSGFAGGIQTITASGLSVPISVNQFNYNQPQVVAQAVEAIKHMLSGNDVFTIIGKVSSIWGDYEVVPVGGAVTLGNDVFRLHAPVEVASGYSAITIYGDARVAAAGTNVVAGNDIIEAGATNSALIIYGDFQSVGSTNVTYGNDTIWGSSLSDTIYGDSISSGTSGGSDYLWGGGGSDQLFGGGGSDFLGGGGNIDLLDGGEGFDYAFYSSGSSVVADLLNPALNTGFEAAGDTYVSIEGLIGTYFADTLRGDNNANWIFGNEGNDTISARGGQDVVYGGDGDDTILGEGGSDTLFGGNGTDSLHGGLGADALNGEAGFDYAAYSYASSGVLADLVTTSANYGEAVGDAYTGIEGLIGSSFGDGLYGDNNANWIFGGMGADYISGRGGADVIVGEKGKDTLFGDAGHDTFVFNAGFGQDVIGDFTAGVGVVDVMQILLGAAFDTYAEVLAVATQTGSDTVLTFDANTSITLQNVAKAGLVADDFRFV